MIVQQMHQTSSMIIMIVVRLIIRVMKVKGTATLIRTAPGPLGAVTVIALGQIWTVMMIVAVLIFVRRMRWTSFVATIIVVQVRTRVVQAKGTVTVMQTAAGPFNVATIIAHGET
jgi:hypothetical protein